jgi:hypothetical protein
MQRFVIKTLVDITRTNVFKDTVDVLKKKQQDNFNTLHRTLEMRGNVYFYNDPYTEILNWENYGYGKKESTWMWEIYTEQKDLFQIDSDPVGAMKKDLEYVPFISNCSESVNFKNNYFQTTLLPINIDFVCLDK